MDISRLIAFGLSLGIPAVALVRPGRTGETRTEGVVSPTLQVSRPARLPVVPSEKAGPDTDSTSSVASRVFGAEVARLSAEADEMDRQWILYKTRCGAQVGGQPAFGREWFSILGQPARNSSETRACLETRGTISRSGARLHDDLVHARAAARTAGLDRATEIGVLRWETLEWPDRE